MAAIRPPGLGKRRNSYMPATDLNMTAWTCFNELFIKIWNNVKTEW